MTPQPGSHGPAAPGPAPPLDDEPSPLDDVMVSLRAERLLIAADRCSALADQMDTFASAYQNRGAVLAHPAFGALVRDFASSFICLTALVDAAEHARPSFDWRALIADGRLVMALERGLERERKLITAKALHRFLEIDPQDNTEWSNFAQDSRYDGELPESGWNRLCLLSSDRSSRAPSDFRVGSPRQGGRQT